MSKRTFAMALLFSLTVTILLRTIWDETTVYSLTDNYTVPTRTPVPPTEKPTNSGGGSGNSGATKIPMPATATNTAVPVTLAPTPLGGFIPTAAACGDQPTIQAVNNTRVRFGPGTNYEIVGELVYLEVRPIIGRAAEMNWWQIMLADNTIGWVADDIVIVQGNISVLPVVAAPALDGVAPTAGAPWNPTLAPGCTQAPVWTSTPQPTVPPTDTPVPPTRTPAPTTAAIEEVPPTETPALSKVEVAVSPTDTPPPTTPPTPIPTAVPLDVQTESTNTGFLPVIAVILLAAGGLIAFLRRNRG